MKRRDSIFLACGGGVRTAGTCGSRAPRLDVRPICLASEAHVCPVRPEFAICLNKRSAGLSDVLVPVIPAHSVDPCAVVEPNGEGASYAAALVEALRKKRGPELSVEIATA